MFFKGKNSFPNYISINLTIQINVYNQFIIMIVSFQKFWLFTQPWNCFLPEIRRNLYTDFNFWVNLSICAPSIVTKFLSQFRFFAGFSDLIMTLLNWNSNGNYKKNRKYFSLFFFFIRVSSIIYIFIFCYFLN